MNGEAAQIGGHLPPLLAVADGAAAHLTDEATCTSQRCCTLKYRCAEVRCSCTPHRFCQAQNQVQGWLPPQIPTCWSWMDRAAMHLGNSAVLLVRHDTSSLTTLRVHHPRGAQCENSSDSTSNRIAKLVPCTVMLQPPMLKH